MLVSNLIKSVLDVFHLIKVFNVAFFAGSNNQPLRTRHEGNFGGPLDGHKVLDRLGAHIDESAQTIVLAEIATGGFVACDAVLYRAHRVQADESGLLAISPEPQRFLGRANGA